MNAQRVTALTFFTLTVCLCGGGAPASPFPQSKPRSKSDADINTIGHRRIDRDANLYSPEKEKQLGKELSEEVEKSSRLLNDRTVTEYIDKVVQNVARNSDARMPIIVRVIDSDAVNAFILPGGYQYINRGLLLRLESEGELASALARGIAHTALRSATKEATKGELMQLSMIPLALSGPVGSSSNGVPLALPLGQLNARRDDESDADYFGVQYLYKTGYDPNCFVSFVQRIWGSGIVATTKMPKVFSAYPPLDERLAALQSEISKILPPRDGATVSTSEFDALLERLRAKKPEGQKQPTLKTEPRNSNGILQPI